MMIQIQKHGVFLHDITVHMVTFPGAKINIGLRITEKRQDGFHNIETLFFPIPLCDALEFVESENQNKGDMLTVTGLDAGGNPGDNLVMKAVRKLRETCSFPYLKMHLHKAIPAGAGLGGGSSDSAFILKGINRCYGLKLDNSQLRSISLELGSDCPFFIDSVPAFAGGRGEILESFNKPLLHNYYMILLNPGINVNTREAYQNCRPAIPHQALSGIIENIAPEKWKDLIINDFEDYAFEHFPLIGHLKEELYRSGAIFSLMSGSGSSVYAIFRNRHTIPEKLRGYIIWQGYLRQPIRAR
jgi:4-diphosphocytidyl-2-C-methyl-D-erythritol kinase